LVIGGKFVAAARGQREYVYGDGVSTVRELVAQLNSDPRRGENYTDKLQIVLLNEVACIALRKQGLEFDSVPEKGRQVMVDEIGDLIEDCTDLVHPSTQETVILAAGTVGLDIAGMDLVVSDISRPLAEQRGCIVEVNAGPGLTPHVAPLIGSPRPVGEAIVELLFPGDRQSKVPTILFLSSPELLDCAAAQADRMQHRGYRVGIAGEDAKTINSWPIYRPLPEFRSLLMHPQLTALVIEVTPDTLADRGLLCEHLSCAIIGNSTLQQALNAPDKSTASAALATISHLLQIGGTLVIVGGSQSSIAPAAKLLNLPESRIVSLSDDAQLASYLSSM
jgi:cyanophycin synthetase